MTDNELRTHFDEQVARLEAELAMLQAIRDTAQAVQPGTEDLNLLENKILLTSLELEDARERLYILDAQVVS